MKDPLVGFAVHVAAPDMLTAMALAGPVARLAPPGAVVEDCRITPYPKVEGTFRISLRLAVSGRPDYEAIKDAFSPGWGLDADDPETPWSVWNADRDGPSSIPEAHWAHIDLFDRSALDP